MLTRQIVTAFFESLGDCQKPLEWANRGAVFERGNTNSVPSSGVKKIPGRHDARERGVCFPHIPAAFSLCAVHANLAPRANSVIDCEGEEIEPARRTFARTLALEPASGFREAASRFRACVRCRRCVRVTPFRTGLGT